MYDLYFGIYAYQKLIMKRRAFPLRLVRKWMKAPWDHSGPEIQPV